MYKVLLVDDERIIRQGIATIIDWEKYGFLLAGSAQNGIEAYAMINEDPPDVVITDIKMPVLDGLGLIAKMKLSHPDIVFVVLSGYGEFDLANEAMKYGVRHYLLKPCNENKIIEVLEDVRDELSQRELREEFVRKTKQNLDKVLPLVREQFLRDFIMNRAYTKEEFQYYCGLLGIEKDRVRLVQFQPEGEYGFEEILYLGTILEESAGKDPIYFHTVMRNQLLALVKNNSEEAIVDLIHRVKEKYMFYNGKDITVYYSEADSLETMPQKYKIAQECLTYSFYLETGSIITRQDIESDTGKSIHNALLFDYDRVGVAVKSGNLEEVAREVERFFSELKSAKLEMNIAKTYCMEFFLSIMRQCKPEDSDKYISKLVSLQRTESLEKLQEFIRTVGTELAKTNYEGIVKRHSKIVRTIINYVQTHMDREELSLKWLASEVMYMNVGYLSKLFIKETGEKFSHYLTRVRMERAKELIEAAEDDRIFEVAQKVGLGENPQYFSQLFKKYTGYTPSEFRDRYTNSDG